MRAVAAISLAVIAACVSPAVKSQSLGEPAPSPQARVASQTQGAPVTDCDTYAASDLDPQRKAKGVPYDELNSALVISACESALRSYPNSSRLLFQLGRAYYKNKDFKSAFVQWRRAAERGYPNAEYNVGLMYKNAQGIVRDDRQAVAWYRKAAEHGFALAQLGRACRETPRKR
jgi:TPR repeat protein